MYWINISLHSSLSLHLARSLLTNNHNSIREDYFIFFSLSMHLAAAYERFLSSFLLFVCCHCYHDYSYFVFTFYYRFLLLRLNGCENKSRLYIYSCDDRHTHRRKRNRNIEAMAWLLMSMTLNTHEKRVAIVMQTIHTTFHFVSHSHRSACAYKNMLLK